MPNLKLKLMLLMACVVLFSWLSLPGCQAPGANETPAFGWWAARGPVVPHDTFPADCSLCHKGGDWQSLVNDFTFDHGTETGVPLVGAHQDAECLRCHNDRGPVAMFADKGCAGCHEDIHQGDLGPNCIDCHNEFNWRPTEIIAKHAATRFPLVGSHAAVGCWQCHPGSDTGNFSGTSTECSTCHGDMLASTVAPGSTAPDHFAQGWTSNCDKCHIPTTWSGGGFNHTGFALTGAHASATCNACHTGGGYSGLPKDCLSCHTTEFNTADNHVAQSFPTDCTLCHSTSTWSGANFNHGAVGISSGCNDCHSADFVVPTNPNHVTLNFPTSCELCHNTHSFAGGTLNHAQLGITNNCAFCHQPEYNATTSPNHMASGFPISCQDCHTTNMWEGATFNHTFPINSGKHNNLSCTECHKTPNNYAAFSCTHCHDHSKSEMDDKHLGEVGGYVWSSPACFNCHKDGKADD